VGGGISLSAAEGKNMPPFRLDKEATEKQNAQDHENCDDNDFYQTHWAKSSVLRGMSGILGVQTSRILGAPEMACQTNQALGRPAVDSHP